MLDLTGRKGNCPPVIVMTSDNYLPACRVSLFLMSRYWNPLPDVTVFGFAAPDFPLPPFARFVSLGSMEDYPVGKWSDSLLAALAAINSKRAIVMLEDYWLTRRVDVQAVALLDKYMSLHEDVVRGDLTDDRQFSGYAKDIAPFDRLDMIMSDPESQYHMSLMPAIWDTELFASFLSPGWSPWQVELEGTPALRKRKGLAVVGTKQSPVRITLGLRGGDSTKVSVDKLAYEDLLALKGLGLLTTWGI